MSQNPQLFGDALSIEEHVLGPHQLYSFGTFHNMEDDKKMLIVTTTTMQNLIIVCFNGIWGEEKKEYIRARANMEHTASITKETLFSHNGLFSYDIVVQ
ncbi:hypothetical protein JHK87_027757 [Glycine soja]|nr:hypothetical protein JHK87_027757 [Glycine soja]